MFTRLGRRIQNGWALGLEAFALAKQHPKLLVFPLLSGLSFIALLVLVVTGAILKPEVFGITSRTVAKGASVTDFSKVVMIAWGFGLYLMLMFIGVFFNTALCSTVIARHLTGRVSLRDGFAAAFRRLPQIFAWSIFAATVGILLAQLKNLLDEYLSWVGWIFGSLLETAWAAMVYFVAPVLAVEGVGPITALKRSAGLLKARWGETAGSEMATSWAVLPLHLFGLAMFAGFAVTTGFFAKGVAMTVPAMIFAGLFFLYILASVVIHTVMSGILKSHLYIYANTGETPIGGDPAVYARAFAPKA